MIAGVDFSTKAIDVVKLDEDTLAPTWSRFDLTEDPLTGEKSGDAFDRTRRVRTAMPATSFWDDVIAVGIEEPAGNMVGFQFRTQGAVLVCIPSRLLVEKWMPSQWRKAVGLSGKASKGEVRDWVLTQGYWHSDWPQDAFDAYCIARAMASVVEVIPG